VEAKRSKLASSANTPQILEKHILTKPFSATLEPFFKAESNYFPICEPTPFLISFLYTSLLESTISSIENLLNNDILIYQNFFVDDH
tara:strand:+ start:158 stop:418 length:261 start_codon:yes stop_codon:yes gene_type:complete